MVPVGEVVAGRYRVVRPLANGGMSHVWLATDDRSRVPRQVAIKQCTTPDGLTPTQHDVLTRWAFPEARAAARVRHQNLIHTFEVVADEGGPWIVMEYVPSRSLQEIVDAQGPLPPARVAAIGLAVLSALTAAHDAGVLHLDVKPGNVLIGHDDRVVLTDFGPAVTTAGIAAFTGAGVVLGSPKYIAPERLFEHSSTVASDMWSLGATLYHAVEGRPPYSRASTTEVLRALADSDPDPPVRAGPLVPVLAGLLRHDPAARLGVAEVEARLRKVAGIRRARSRRWWPPRRPRRVLPEPAHEATAAERAARPGEDSATPAPAAGAGEAPAPLGRSVDTPQEPGRPWLRRRLAVAAVVLILLGLAVAVTGTTHRDTGAAQHTVRSPAPAAPADFGWWADPSGSGIAGCAGWWRAAPARTSSNGAPHGTPGSPPCRN